MKKTTIIGWGFLLSTVLCACPFSSVYQLEDEPSAYVEDQLLGKWAAFMNSPSGNKPEPVKMILSKKSDMEYEIDLIGFVHELRSFRVSNTDTLKGTAFLSYIDGRKFFNIHIRSQVYIAELRIKDDKLSLLPLSEHFTAKMIRNNSALRKSVEIHYKTRVMPMLDDDFCIKDMIRVN
ncbi:MAG: hypothetical protein IPI66_03755 [Chitinophagaceae bacterium]|nr:hypothetical protein [Chitinophagaceae bacterium]MBL0055467.1 hypothetical protein [Chitinophagaceae bacterium]